MTYIFYSGILLFLLFAATYPEAKIIADSSRCGFLLGFSPGNIPGGAVEYMGDFLSTLAPGTL